MLHFGEDLCLNFLKVDNFIKLLFGLGALNLRYHTHEDTVLFY